MDSRRQGVDCPNCGNELVWESYYRNDENAPSYYKCYDQECSYGILKMDTEGVLKLVSKKYTGVSNG